MTADRYADHTVIDRIKAFSEHSKLRRPLVSIVTKLQDEKPEIRVLAPGLTFALMCEALGLNPHEILAQVRRAARHVNGPFTVQYEAMVDYVKGEILRGE